MNEHGLGAGAEMPAKGPKVQTKGQCPQVSLGLGRHVGAGPCVALVGERLLSGILIFAAAVLVVGCRR
jgi:hypothetical protein